MGGRRRVHTGTRMIISLTAHSSPDNRMDRVDQTLHVREQKFYKHLRLLLLCGREPMTISLQGGFVLLFY